MAGHRGASHESKFSSVEIVGRCRHSTDAAIPTGLPGSGDPHDRPIGTPSNNATPWLLSMPATNDAHGSTYSTQLPAPAQDKSPTTSRCTISSDGIDLTFDGSSVPDPPTFVDNLDLPLQERYQSRTLVVAANVRTSGSQLLDCP